MKTYHILIGTNRQGPYSIEELNNMDLPDITMILEEGSDEWVKLSDFHKKLNSDKYEEDNEALFKVSKKTLAQFLIYGFFLIGLSFLSHQSSDLIDKSYTMNEYSLWPFTSIVYRAYQVDYSGISTSQLEFEGFLYGFNSLSFFFWLLLPMFIKLIIKLFNVNIHFNRENTRFWTTSFKLLILGLGLNFLAFLFSLTESFNKLEKSWDHFWPFIKSSDIDKYGFLAGYDFKEFTIYCFAIIMAYLSYEIGHSVKQKKQ
jgi:hypothetical protein